jgi:adenylate cyclase, class 2
METEYEAKFLNVDKDEVRARLKAAGATLERPEFPQRRWVFDLPAGRNSKHSFVRVRDEGGIMTLTLKKFAGTDVDHPQESETVVADFDAAVEIVTEIGCVKRSYQENNRELWTLGDVKITIDSWPFYEPFVEVEATSEEAVREASIKVGFDWSKALFCGVSKLFKMKYGDAWNIREMPKLTFDMPNPFV